MSASPPIAIVAALRDEATYINRSKFPLVRITGMGRERMIASLEQLLAQHTPARIILVGFAGGLHPAHQTADVLHIKRVLHHDREPIELTSGEHTLLTTDALADTVPRKRELYKQTQADAVDMETYHAAAFLRDRNIPLTVLRSITDPADAALPAESLNWVREDGSPNAAAAMKHLLSHPHHLPMLIQLGRSSKRAARALAAALHCDHESA